MSTPQPAKVGRFGIMDFDFTRQRVLMRSSDEANSPWKWVDTREYETRQETLPAISPGAEERLVCIECVVITFDDGTQRIFNPADEVEIGLVGGEIS
jgi:hypothetical protein